MPGNQDIDFKCSECYCCECEPCTPDGDRVRCCECGAVYDVEFIPQFRLRKFGRFHDLTEAEAEGATA